MNTPMRYCEIVRVGILFSAPDFVKRLSNHRAFFFFFVDDLSVATSATDKLEVTAKS